MLLLFTSPEKTVFMFLKNMKILVFRSDIDVLKIFFVRLKMLKMILGVLLGAAAGFAYYKFIGCASGTCPITSNPYMSIAYGAGLGLLVTW